MTHGVVAEPAHGEAARAAQPQHPAASLDDKYTAVSGRVLLSGTQALARLPMLQRERDLAAGLNTAGFISGYRGSPLGGLDQTLWKARKHLEAHHIRFQPGVNEDLAATAIWGTQQVNLHPGATYDGVFAMWYGKGPGVDRCGDVFRHANAAGTSRHGGVLVVAGDDHAARSSTVPHQTEHVFKAVMMPVLAPSGVQEYLDFGIHGWALSRWCGCWVAFKAVADTVESSASVDIDPQRVRIVLPQDFVMPPGGLNIRWPDPPLVQEERLLHHKLYAALAYCRANRLNRIVIDSPAARLGIIAAGKSYLDVRQAFDDLGIDEDLAAEIGIRLYKVGMPWPLESEGVRAFAEGLDEILVVEEKRQLLEYQLKEELYNWREDVRPRVIGKFDEKGEWALPHGNWLLPAASELTPAMIARAIAARVDRFFTSARIQARLAFLQAKEQALAQPGVTIQRTPYFCPGCPHNTSTVVPEGSRALAGIGCHYMAIWMDRRTATFSHMGGEGAAWIGQAPFTSEKHVFANLGDGTYFHSGLLAVRAAVAAFNTGIANSGAGAGQALGLPPTPLPGEGAGPRPAPRGNVDDHPPGPLPEEGAGPRPAPRGTVDDQPPGPLPEEGAGPRPAPRGNVDDHPPAPLPEEGGDCGSLRSQVNDGAERRRPGITYKILYNDAVAMTGGQPVDGMLTVGQMTRQLAAEGVERIVIVTDDPARYANVTDLARGVPVRHRDEMDAVQKELREIPGVTALIYEQTCAAEKRRRRKRGAYPDPARRVFINELVCEGCGDCGTQSNCLAVVPVDTEFGRKRAIDQSACNKDFSCLKGFCPSFVTVEGGRPRRGKARTRDESHFADPPLPALPATTRPWGILITGVGGSGVVTIGALIGMAAHLDGKGVTVLDQTGLAQKGGAVQSHVRIADDPAALHAVRIAAGEANAVIGGDIVVTASAEALAKMQAGRARVVVNCARTPTADFTRNPDWQFPLERMQAVIAEAVGAEAVDSIDATDLATRLMGDAIYANLFLLGHAWQRGLVPVSLGALEQAIALNGVQVEQNRRALLWGRRAALDEEAVRRFALPAEASVIRLTRPQSLDELIARRVEFLCAYQNRAYAARYEALVRRVREAEASLGGSALAEAVARGYFKLLAYKDEFEVARLYAESDFRERVAASFEGDYALNFHLAPPMLGKVDPHSGLPVKRAFGPWMLLAFRLLAKLRFLRGTPLDPFARTEERRAERQLIAEYECDVAEILDRLDAQRLALAVELAGLPEQIRGFGHVKAKSIEAARRRRDELRHRLAAGTPPAARAA
jgi:TPP-dependent indolepyruvate ferredoxin oxidoreductase alpha subunit/Pyruvate/2-oxoacid:ferredoxin oxidoreductase gamma subunit